MVASRAIAAIVAVAVAAILAVIPLQAQPVSATPVWGEPVLVYATTGGVFSPTLVADPSGDVHLFFVSSTSTESGNAAYASGAVLYTRLHQGRWSPPVEVLATPGGGAPQQPTVALDTQGVLHVVWKGGIGNRLFYSQAHVSEALGPSGWAAPTVLADQQLSPGGFGLPSALAALQDGSVHLVYASTDGRLRSRSSEDGGRTWSPAVPLFAAGPSEDASDLPRLAADSSGRLHLTWTQLQRPNGWPPTGAFYSRSLDGGNTWEPPTRVVESDHGLVVPVVAAPDVVHLVWNSVAKLGERGYRQSADGGETFSAVEKVAGGLGGGFTGFPGAAIDSAGALHLATILNTTDGTSGGTYHLVRDQAGWSAPAYLSKGATGKRSVEQPTLAITLGNRLHVAYEDDFQRIWYVGGLADAPAIAPREIPRPVRPTPESEPTATSVPTPPAPTLAPPAAPAAAALTFTGEQQASSNPGSPLLLSLAPIGLLLVALLIYGIRRHGS